MKEINISMLIESSFAPISLQKENAITETIGWTHFDHLDLLISKDNSRGRISVCCVLVSVPSGLFPFAPVTITTVDPTVIAITVIVVDLSSGLGVKLCSLLTLEILCLSLCFHLLLALLDRQFRTLLLRQEFWLL